MYRKLSLLFVLPLLAISTSFAFTSNKDSKPVISYAWTGNQTPSVGLSFYNSCKGLEGDELKEALMFNAPDEFEESAYDNYRFREADEAQYENTYIISLYTRHNIPKSNSGASDYNYSWDRWNREHIYTQTRFPKSIWDNHNIFACEGSTNSQRSDRKYANVRTEFYNAVKVYSSDGHDTGCYRTDSYFEPQDDAKGEVARAVLYCALYYGYELTDIAYNAETILKWHNAHQVSNREIRRNNVVYGNQGNRNPFVDHPSYASKIFGGDAYPYDDPLSPHVESVSLNVTNASLKSGETLQLIATVYPDDAVNKKVNWTTSNYLVANINPVTGIVTAYNEGTATITVTTEENQKTASCRITVTGGGGNESTSTGCGGNIVTTSVILSTLSILGLGLLLIKRKFNK